MEAELATLTEHNVLLTLVAGEPLPEERRSTTSRLLAALDQHRCEMDDHELIAELESLLAAWSGLGHPSALWTEIQSVVESHVELADTSMAVHWPW